MSGKVERDPLNLELVSFDPWPNKIRKPAGLHILNKTYFALPPPMSAEEILAEPEDSRMRQSKLN